MECASISRRVHDELGQALTALQWDVAWLTSRLSPTTRNDEVTEKLDAMSESIATALHTVRKVACELRPPMLDQFGLLAAINWQAGEFQTRFGIPCEVAADGEPVVANRETATGVFRIFQEILTNIARHARATHVGVRLAEESGRVTLVVQDNGCGIATGRQTASLGILGMHERASLLGGTLEIHTSVGSGTTVIVRIPLQKGDGESGAPLTENQRGFV